MDTQYSKRRRRRGLAVTRPNQFSLLKNGMAVDGTTATVNPAHIALVCNVARTHPVVQTVIEKVLGDTVDRFTIRLRYGDDRVDLPESEKRIIEVVWPSFVRELLWHLQVVGLAVVAADRDKKTPRIVPLAYVRVRFAESAAKPRVYWVEDLQSQRPLDAVVFIRNHPLADGTLTSPAAGVVHLANRYDRVLENQSDADFDGTHPAYLFEMDKNGRGIPDPQEHDQFFAGDLAEHYRDYHESVADQAQSILERSKRNAAAGFGDLVAKATRMGTRISPGATSAPWLNSLFVPLNQHVTAGPVPRPNPHFAIELETIESRILQAFRVPPAVMDSTQVHQFAAQNDVGLKQWGATVRSIQRELCTAMSETYMFVAADVFEAYAAAILGEVGKERDAAAERVSKRVRGDEPPVGKPPTTNDQGILQMPETDESMERAARVLSTSNAEVIAHLRAKLSVDVEFHSRPTLTLEELRALHEAGLISRDVFAEKAAEMFGMPLDSFLIGAEVQTKDARERKKISDILEPPEEKPKTASKPAKKRPASK